MPGTRLIHYGGENPFKPACGQADPDAVISFEAWKVSCRGCIEIAKAAEVVQHVKEPEQTWTWALLTGRELDTQARWLGAERYPMETDAEFRTRLRETVR